MFEEEYILSFNYDGKNLIQVNESINEDSDIYDGRYKHPRSTRVSRPYEDIHKPFYADVYRLTTQT